MHYAKSSRRITATFSFTLPLSPIRVLCWVLIVSILVYLRQLVVIFGRDCAAASTLYLSRQILTKTSSSSSQSRLFPCFQRGSHSAGKPHNFRAAVPPVSKTRHVHVSHTTWPTRVPYYVCRVCFFGPPYPSDCTGDDSATCYRTTYSSQTSLVLLTHRITLAMGHLLQCLCTLPPRVILTVLYGALFLNPHLLKRCDIPDIFTSGCVYFFA